MTYKPDYSIELSNGKIALLFNSWTFRQYSQKIGVELDDLYELIKSGKAIKSKDLPTLLLIAAESFSWFNDQEFKYTEKDAYKWIDEVGGFNSPRFMDVFKVFVGKFLNIAPERLEVIWQKAVNPGEEETKEGQPKKKKTAKS